MPAARRLHPVPFMDYRPDPTDAHLHPHRHPTPDRLPTGARRCRPVLDVNTPVSVWGSIVAIAIRVAVRIGVVAVEFGARRRVVLIRVIIIDLPCTTGH